MSQVAQATVSARYGMWLGIGAAALLLFALFPLRRLARKLGDALFPGVEDTPEYLDRRRQEVYREAVALGLVDPASDGTLLSGDVVLGKYRILRAIGEGGHARTYLAEQARTSSRVVVKLLRAGDGADAMREARATAAVRHANIVQLHDVEAIGARVLLVMEHVEGGSLKDRLAAGTLSPAEFRRVGVGLLSALEAVHHAGGVHRDVKPSNVLLTREGDPKLADFGVARVAVDDATVGIGGLVQPVGTLRYMSPEQARGMRATPQSDLFSATATLYEAWTGEAWRAPRPSESHAEMQARAAAGEPFDRVVEPAALRAWLARGLDPSPHRRFASAAEAREALVAALA